MHWAPAHVNPMVALRTVVCNDRWAKAWPQVTANLRGAARQRSQHRRQQRHLAVVAPQAPAAPPAPSRSPRQETAPAAPRRPTPDHPWRRYRHLLTHRVA